MALLAPVLPGAGLFALADENEPARATVYTGTGQQALAKAYPDAARWMTLNDDRRVLGVFFPTPKEPAKGAVLLLNDAGETAVSGVNGTLAARLARRGWSVLALGLERPGPGLQRLLERPSSASSTEDEGDSAPNDTSVMIDVAATESDEDDPVSRYKSHLRDVLGAGVGELKGMGYERVAVVGVGTACNYLLELDRNGSESVAVVWIDPAFYPAESDALVDRLMAAEGVRVLELEILTSDAASAGPGRQADLAQAGFSGYERQRVAASHPPQGLDGETIASRISAWLNPVSDAD